MSKVVKFRKRVTHTEKPFDLLDETTIQLWISKAQTFLGKQGWSWDDFAYAELVYSTAVYLYHVEKLLSKQAVYPCYVVHSQDDESRFESGSYVTALNHFKRLDKDGHCVALFHWPDKRGSKRLYASEGYHYSRDYGSSNQL